ncbi:MAG: AAA family ATPase [Planctomycetota bacterium]
MTASSLSSTTTAEIVRLLALPASYGDGSTKVDMIETHLSYVFLSRTLATKLKKSVHFQFVDFSTADARRAACEAEVNLNRLWSDDVYHGVVAITREANGRLAIGGEGEPVEWVVQMRRLAISDSLQHRLKYFHVTPAEAGSLAEYLVSKYLYAPRIRLSPHDYVERVRDHQQANTRDLLATAETSEQPRILRIQSGLAGLLWIQRELFEERAASGRIIAGHGDLRPEHIFLESPPQLIDGIEFSEELRTVDVLDELCFLQMECERLGGHHVSHAILEAYQQQFDEVPSAALVDFYKAYRATVRAKVAALQLSQTPGNANKKLLSDLRSHLTWADSFAQRLGRPWLVVVCGLMGTGKSTLAGAIAKMAGASHLQTDGIRQRLFGPSASPARYKAGHYTDRARRQVYDALLAEAADTLDRGVSVVLDGAFLSSELREAAEKIASRRAASVLFAQCTAPRSVVLRRLARREHLRSSESEARPELYDQQAAEQESFDASDRLVRVSTTDPVEQQLESIRVALRAMERL